MEYKWQHSTTRLKVTHCHAHLLFTAWNTHRLRRFQQGFNLWYSTICHKQGRCCLCTENTKLLSRCTYCLMRHVYFHVCKIQKNKKNYYQMTGAHACLYVWHKKSRHDYSCIHMRENGICDLISLQSFVHISTLCHTCNMCAKSEMLWNHRWCCHSPGAIFHAMHCLYDFIVYFIFVLMQVCTCTEVDGMLWKLFTYNLCNALIFQHFPQNLADRICRILAYAIVYWMMKYYQLWFAWQSEKITWGCYFPTDLGMHINTAIFEQTAHSGYVLKPRVMWDQHHVMYNRFNPWEKDYDGLQSTTLTINVSTS